MSLLRVNRFNIYEGIYSANNERKLTVYNSKGPWRKRKEKTNTDKQKQYTIYVSKKFENQIM